MIEINDHKAYELLNNKYKRVCLDYVIFLSDDDYDGVKTHKNAIIEAFGILNKRFADYDYSICIETDKMIATKISLDELLTLPTDYYDHERELLGN